MIRQAQDRMMRGGLAERVAGAIKARRKARGWTQQKLAEELARLGLDLSRSAVAMHETGSNVPLAVLEAYSLALGVPVEELVAGE